MLLEGVASKQLLGVMEPKIRDEMMIASLFPCLASLLVQSLYVLNMVVMVALRMQLEPWMGAGER